MKTDDIQEEMEGMFVTDTSFVLIKNVYTKLEYIVYVHVMNKHLEFSII